MLSVSQLSKFYGNFKAVDQVSFDMGQGEIVGLLGQNGAGKTTIMKMISGFLEPDTGTVIVNQFNMANQAKLAQKSIGYLPESLPVYPEMTVADYLDYAADLKGLINNKYEQIKLAIQATELEDKLSAPIGTLSRGYKQRVGVAQAVLGEPKLLILDEPTNGLDPTQTEHMRQLIRRLAKSATVILSTHIMQEVDALCDRVLIIRQGQLALDAKLSELRNSHYLTLNTSLNQQQVNEILSSISTASVEHCIAQNEQFSYRIKLHHGHDDKVQAKIAKGIFEQGGDLFALVPEHKDLESVFREIYQQNAAQSEVSHAA